MMPQQRGSSQRANVAALLMVCLMLSLPMTPLFSPKSKVLEEEIDVRSTGQSYDAYEQPWAQYGRTPTHNFSMPIHDPNGGPGEGNVSDVTSLASLVEPVVNWQVFNSGDGSDAYGSVIGDFSQSISASQAALERCGQGTLFPVMISSTIVDGSRESFLNIISGNDAKIAWRVSLGVTEAIRSTPIIHDIDSDGFQEIIAVYDTQGALNIDVWSPRLTCTESNWASSGHSNELLWSYSDSDVRIGSPSPHFATANSDHKAVTQPLLADLELDGTPELVLAVVDDPNDNPTPMVNAYSLENVQPSDAEWSVNLDRGTHPSDPVWAQLDGSTTSVLLTTIDGNTGNMWIWKIDGDSGSLDWERVAIQGTDSDSDSPRLRLPGPVITQLDGDDAPEMVLTVPTDPNGRTSGNGARFIGMEITSTTEVFNFRAQNGYADAQPLPLDTDEDGISDRLCWVTWYSESSVSFNRKGMLGCTDISDENPVTEWTRDLQRGSGNDNDEIAVSPPIWMDIDDEGTPEIIVAFGRRVWAFDGDTGASADINNEWSTPLNMPHRTWTAPALADVDGDGHIDLLVGDTLVSNRGPDFAPSSDGRGLSFNPAQADPGALVTVTAQFSNVGTGEADDDLDAAIVMNGVELTRERFTESEPVAPTAEGGPQTFTAEFTAELGLHEFELVLDVNQNITEQREDNNRAVATYQVVEPHVAELDGPIETTRINPGTTQTLSVLLTATGSRTADWTLSYDDSNLPGDWTFQPSSGSALSVELTPQVSQTVDFDTSIPQDALGDESGVVTFLLSLNDDVSVNTTLQVPIEVFRTRGLDMVGASGLNSSMGQGRPGTVAKSWFMVENLGNAVETTTSITWTAPSWGGSPSLHDANGNELFSVNLQPGEEKELFAYLNTPVSTTIGSSTETTLTMCMGSGEEALCESLSISFTAVEIAATPTHHRTLPNHTLAWQLDGELPSSGQIQWNMAAAAMIQPSWVWTTTGDWNINGSFLESTGVPQSAVGGELQVYIPENAVPKRHAFFDQDVNEANMQLNLTLQVLQIYRSNISLIEPTSENQGEALSLNVSEPHRFLLFLENPGNGEDTFVLTASIESPNHLSTPEIDFTFYDPQKTLGALSTGIGSVDVELSEEIPALLPFTIRFTWTSLGGDLVAQSTTAHVQAAPSHEWHVDLLNQSSIEAAPGTSVQFDFNVTNRGNAPDRLTFLPLLNIVGYGNDTVLWTADEVSTSVVPINQSTSLRFTLVVPLNTWAGTISEISLQHVASTYVIGQTSVNVTVAEIYGWKLNLTGTDLEIDPAGQNLTLELVHQGNGHEIPYFAKAGAGWNITLPDAGDLVEPYGTTQFTVTVQPPEDAIAGEVGVMRIRITGDNLNGKIVEEIPLRVGVAPQLDIDHRGTWNVNNLGGYPTAWIVNEGNDVALITLDVDGLPEGWTTQQGVQMVLAPGEVKGMPLSLTPAVDWNQQRFLLTINVNHPILGTLPHNVEVEYSHLSFASTPVIDSYIGTEHTFYVHDAAEEELVLSATLELQRDNEQVTFTQPNDSGEVQISYAGASTNGNLSLYIVARTYPDASASCDFIQNAFDELGRTSLTGSIGQCNLVASEHEDLRAVLTLITSDGERILIDDDAWTVAAGDNATVNITLSDWNPQPGEFILMATMYDQFGRELDQSTQAVVARATEWNIGINSLTSDGDITVGIQRTGYSVLADAVCELAVSAAGGWSSTYYVDVAYSDFAPVILIENPGDIEKDEKITAVLSCSVPFDVDDDPEDDTATTFYKPESLLSVSSSDVEWIIGSAIVVMAIAWLSGIIRPRQEPAAPRQSLGPKTEIKASKKEETVDEIDDIQLEMDDTEEEEISVEFSQHDTLPVDDVTSTIEIIETEDATVESNPSASGRLASMRDELGENDVEEREGSIKDRMDQFFGR